MSSWDPADPNVLELPSGRLLRGRSLRRGTPSDSGSPSADWAHTAAEFELVLLGSRRAFESRNSLLSGAESRWVKWPDFSLPSDRSDAVTAMRELWERASSERTGVACTGGRGRTGTALACIAVIDGLPAREAVDFVRRGYDARAIETPWQKRFVEHFAVTRRA